MESSTKPDAPALESFTCFPNLPIELRLCIWRYAFPPSQVVDIGVKIKDELQEFEPSLLPTTLYVNKESRDETLKHYSIVFQEAGIVPSGVLMTERKICCLDPTKDTLSFSSYPIEKLTQVSDIDMWLTGLNRDIRGGLQAVRYLEILEIGSGHVWDCIADLARHGPRRNVFAEIFKPFTGLQTLTLAVSYSSWESGILLNMLKDLFLSSNDKFRGEIVRRDDLAPNDEFRRHIRGVMANIDWQAGL